MSQNVSREQLYAPANEFNSAGPKLTGARQATCQQLPLVLEHEKTHKSVSLRKCLMMSVLSTHSCRQLCMLLTRVAAKAVLQISANIEVVFVKNEHLELIVQKLSL